MWWEGNVVIEEERQKRPPLDSPFQQKYHDDDLKCLALLWGSLCKEWSWLNFHQDTLSKLKEVNACYLAS